MNQECKRKYHVSPGIVNFFIFIKLTEIRQLFKMWCSNMPRCVILINVVYVFIRNNILTTKLHDRTKWRFFTNK